MTFLKKHKIKLIILCIFIIIFGIALVTLINILYPDSKKDVYGNRLKGLDNVKISNQDITKVKDDMNNDSVLNVEYLLNGRLVSFIIKVKDDSNKNEIKNLVNVIKDTFSEEIKNCYDIQVLIESDNEESEKYPIFAYKHKNSEDFVWTKN